MSLDPTIDLKSFLQPTHIQIIHLLQAVSVSLAFGTK